MLTSLLKMPAAKPYSDLLARSSTCSTSKAYALAVGIDSRDAAASATAAASHRCYKTLQQIATILSMCIDFSVG